MRNKYATHVDFTFLMDIAGKKLPSNIDMVLERNGYFLIGEWKRENELLSQGQLIMLKRLAQAPRFSVFIITGHTDDELPVVSMVQQLMPDGGMEKWGESVHDFRRIVKEWLEFAEEQ
jgi:hypothetical protein